MIQIFPHYEELSQHAANLIVQKANAAVSARGNFSFVLSGGETPRRTYELLAQSKNMPWEKTHIFWGDERCVPPTDPRSNYVMAKNSLLKYITIPAEQIYRIDCQAGAGLSAQKYQATLRQFFKENSPQFDLILLGLGSDGHTASLFPGSVGHNKKDNWVVESVSPTDGVARVSLTAEAINGSREIIFLVHGLDKAEIVRRVLSKSHDALKLPAQTIIPNNGNLSWFLDQGAANLL